MNAKCQRSLVVSLIGRPNVGKSTIFNRLMGKANKTMTYNKPGVTRDRHYGVTKINALYEDNGGQEIILVDTGGFYPENTEADIELAKKKGSHKDIEKATFDTFFNIMTDHAQIAIDESDLVLLVVDVREGLLPFDEGIAQFIRERKSKFWLVINKYDSDGQAGDEVDFYNLGLDYDDMFMVSGAHGVGIDPLKEALQKMSKTFTGESNLALQKGVTPREEVVARFSIIGAPNAGKSTLLNHLVGAQRALVSNIAGTTVDPIEGFFDLFFGSDVERLSAPKISVSDSLLIKEYEDYQKNNVNSHFLPDEDDLESADFSEDLSDSDAMVGNSENLHYDNVFSDENDEDEIIEDEKDGNQWRSIHLIDTAGIRRKNSVDGFIETQSVYRALRCITESDIILYMVDATMGIGHQDRRLIDIAMEKGKSVIILLNKVDLMKDKVKTAKERKGWLLDLRAKIPWLYFCDLIPISAMQGRHIRDLKVAMRKTVLIRHQKIHTSDLNHAVTELVDRHSVTLSGSRGKPFKVKYASMVKSTPPTFLLFSNKSKGIPDNYRRYLQNGIRYAFGLDNTPVHLIFRTGYDLDKREKKVNKSK